MIVPLIFAEVQSTNRSYPSSHRSAPLGTHRKSMAVVQCDERGNEIATFPSKSAAARFHKKNEKLGFAITAAIDRMVLLLVLKHTFKHTSKHTPKLFTHL